MGVRLTYSACVVGLLLACKGVEAQSSEPHNALDSLRKTIDKQSTQVEQQFPAAKLFQVSIYNVIPRDFTAGKTDSQSVQSSYYIGKTEKFVQAVEEPSKVPSGWDTVLLEKSSKRQDCKKGYPGPGDQVCAEQQGGPEHEPPVIRPDMIGKLPLLMTKLSGYGVNEDRPIALTFTTANRVLETITQSHDNAELVKRLQTMDPSEPVVLVSQSDKSGIMALFDGNNGEFLGKSVRRPSLSPPSREH